MNKRTSMSLSGASGEFFVAGELSRQGIIALPTSRNTKGFDIIATNLDFTKTNYLQVKTNKEKYFFWIVGKALRPSPDRFYIFVNLIDMQSRPEYYVVPTIDVWTNYSHVSNAKDYAILSATEKQAVLSRINNGRSAWQIVYELGIKINAVRQIASNNEVKIKYDRGKGVNFPYAFYIDKNKVSQYLDRWDLLTL